MGGPASNMLPTTMNVAAVLLLASMLVPGSKSNGLTHKINIHVPHTYHHHTHTKHHFIPVPVNQTTPPPVFFPGNPLLPGAVIPGAPGVFNPGIPGQTGIFPGVPGGTNTQPAFPQGAIPPGFPVPGQFVPQGFPQVGFPAMYVNGDYEYIDVAGKQRRDKTGRADKIQPQKQKTIINMGDDATLVPLSDLLELQNSNPNTIKVDVTSDDRYIRLNQRKKSKSWKRKKPSQYHISDISEYESDEDDHEIDYDGTSDMAHWVEVKDRLEEQMQNEFPDLKIRAEIVPVKKESADDEKSRNPMRRANKVPHKGKELKRYRSNAK